MPALPSLKVFHGVIFAEDTCNSKGNFRFSNYPIKSSPVQSQKHILCMNIKTKIVTALTLAVLVVPGISMAQTMSVAQLQAEIQSLTIQLQSLEAQLAAQGGLAQWCYTFNTNLSIGMSGNAVTELQTALQKDGESVNVTGTFDKQTESAVSGFQQKYTSDVLVPYGLTNGTGYAGATTRAKLNSLYGCDIVSQIVSYPPATISTSTTVTVTIQNPSAGQTFTQGASNIVAWTGTQSAAALMLYDVSGQTFEGTISPSLVSSALTGSGNSYSWNAQALYGSSGSASTIAPGSYRLKVTDNRGDFAMSNVFSVVAPATISTSTTVTTPTITNVAPNQGTLGTSITISGIDLGGASEIALCNAQNQCNGFVNGNNATVSSDGTSLVFSIPGVFFPSPVVGGTTQLHVVTPAGNSNSWPFQVLPAN
jgi:hypothetical protein